MHMIPATTPKAFPIPRCVPPGGHKGPVPTTGPIPTGGTAPVAPSSGGGKIPQPARCTRPGPAAGDRYTRPAVCPPPGGFVNPTPLPGAGAVLRPGHIGPDKTSLRTLPGPLAPGQATTGAGQAAPQPGPVAVDAYVASHGGR